jgi:hypothetical protein
MPMGNQNDFMDIVSNVPNPANIELAVKSDVAPVVEKQYTMVSGTSESIQDCHMPA